MARSDGVSRYLGTPYSPCQSALQLAALPHRKLTPGPTLTDAPAFFMEVHFYQHAKYFVRRANNLRRRRIVEVL